MRLATLEGGRVAVVGDQLVLPLGPSHGSIRELAAAGADGLGRVRSWVESRPDGEWAAVADVRLGPAVPDPGAIYTIGLNYGPSDEPDPERPPRPLVYGKLPTSVAGDRAVLSWDRTLTANVDPEVELGVVIGAEAFDIDPGDALSHVFGYTIINDVSSRDEWLDGDQWLLGKSMAGFCPVGPWIVTADEIDPADLRLACRLNGVTIQEGRTTQLRFSITEIVAYLSRHTVLRPGDLIATGTPARLSAPPGPDRHLQAGDIVSVSIEHIGELTTIIA
jgi:2-keto-4-pentenoate hydratase/2-oxohepta-3-ene-1,7-dioic acid hydratase in catechol pathway